MRANLTSVNIYPNGGLDLRERLAAEFDVKVANVIAGSGSDGIMSNIIRAFLCDDDEVLTTESAFIGFQVLARSRGVAYRTVPYRQWHYDLEGLAAAITERTKIIYLANPNNPTGTIFTKHEFDEFYRHVPERVLIILDEAYFEYANDQGLCFRAVSHGLPVVAALGAGAAPESIRQCSCARRYRAGRRANLLCDRAR